MRNTALFIALSFATCLSAQAADKNVDSDDINYSYDYFDWNGFYVGAKGGLHLPRLDTAANGVYNGNGIGYGVYAGYLQQLDLITLGVEAHYKMGSADTKNGGANIDYDISGYGAKAKIGYALSTGAMPTLASATAGVIHSTFDFEGGTKTVETGLSLGVDVDIALSEKMLLGFEVSHEMYKDVSNGTTTMDITNPSIFARLGLKF